MTIIKKYLWNGVYYAKVEHEGSTFEVRNTSAITQEFLDAIPILDVQAQEIIILSEVSDKDLLAEVDKRGLSVVSISIKG